MAYQIALSIDLTKYVGTGADDASISFQLSGVMFDEIANKVITPHKEAPALTAGVGSISLPATKNDSDISPAGLTYKIRLLAPNIDQRWEIELDKDLGNTQNLADLPPASHVVTVTYATASALNTHVADSTDVHGIADTAQLATLDDLADVTPEWGNVSGTLSAQTDLATALAAKVSTTTFANVNRTPVLVVASSTASDAEKALADEVCDGTSDDERIQAAIDALPDAGGTVMLSSGIFSISAKLALPSLVTLEGQGRFATVLQQADSSNLDAIIETTDYATLETNNAWFVDVDDCAYGYSIRHLSIDGNNANQTAGDGYGVHLWGKGITVEDVLIRDCRGVGYYSDCGSQVGQDDYRDIPSGYVGPLWVRNCGSHGIQVAGPHDITLPWLVSAANGGDGIRIETPADLLFCHVYANTTDGVNVTSAGQLRASYIQTETNSGAGLRLAGAKSFVAHAFGHGTSTWGGHNESGHLIISADDCVVQDALFFSGLNTYAIDISGDRATVGATLPLATPTSAHIHLGAVTGCRINATVNAAKAAVLEMASSSGNNLVDVTAAISGTASHWNGKKHASDRVRYTGSGTAGLSANAGSATVASGDTTIVVTHGLLRTPNASEILLTPTTSLGTATSWWVDTRTNTDFTINLDADAGADVVFAWRAELTDDQTSGASASTLLSDTFTDTDNTLLTAHTPDTGSGTWTLKTGTSPKISSNKLIASNSSLSHVHTDVGVSDGTLSASVTCATGSAANIVIRSTDANNHIGLGINSSLALSFYKLVSGTSTDLRGGENPTYTSGTTHTLKLIANGSSVKAYVDDVLVQTATVTDLETVTNVGVRMNSGTSASIDDLVMTDATS